MRLESFLVIITVYISSASSFSGFRNHQTKHSISSENCPAPATPRNGNVDCQFSDAVQSEIWCTFTCHPGYRFADMSTGSNIVSICEVTTGSFDVPVIADCVPNCSPSCYNGGICDGPNICLCPHPYYGPQCLQSHLTLDQLCNVTHSPRYGYWNCQPDGAGDKVCVASCLPTFVFERPHSPQYTCDQNGVWTPNIYTVPDCTPDVTVPPPTTTVTVPVTVPVTAHQCENVVAPRFGVMNCIPDSAYGKICVPRCLPTFTFERPPPVFYVCNDNGIWTPNIYLVPNCIPENTQGVSTTFETIVTATCNPPCMNGGTCTEFNTCICPDQNHDDTCENIAIVEGDWSPNCPLPAPLRNGLIYCRYVNESRLEIKCSYMCEYDYDFEGTMAVTYEFICNVIYGYTGAHHTPKCVPECYPPCSNGGLCMNNNVCNCIPPYFGDRCLSQTSIVG
ncbi:unnamed protein product [Lymnaea stagnalis]|uniref:Uncharacterized protein n=1 Tax=Lymnaea stagnalis TaxID=6523 RepID=A0AAV2H9C0_LYMST